MVTESITGMFVELNKLFVQSNVTHSTIAHKTNERKQTTKEKTKQTIGKKRVAGSCQLLLSCFLCEMLLMWLYWQLNQRQTRPRDRRNGGVSTSAVIILVCKVICQCPYLVGEIWIEIGIVCAFNPCIVLSIQFFSSRSCISRLFVSLSVSHFSGHPLNSIEQIRKKCKIYNWHSLIMVVAWTHTQKHTRKKSTPFCSYLKCDIFEHEDAIWYMCCNLNWPFMIYCILIDAIFVVVGNGGRRIEHEQGNNISTVHKFFFYLQIVLIWQTWLIST